MPAANISPQDYTKAVLGVYFDAIQQWNKSYDSAKQAAYKHNAESRPAQFASEVPAAPPKSIVTRVYHRVIENQMERCRFAEHRLSQYLGLPEAAARCKSPLDVLAFQTSFLKRAFDDYAMEGARMMEMFWPWSPRSVLNQACEGLKP
jgi:hypothetical protein